MTSTKLPPGFELLGLQSDSTVQDVRRAYAKQVKEIDLAVEPETFQRLREAYESAITWFERREPDDAPTIAALSSDEVAQNAFRSVFALDLSKGEEVMSRLMLLLNEPALQAIEARQHFEHMLVRQLAAGWQLGHETLFEAAVVALAWDLDPERLRAYGEPGVMLCGAIHDRDRFESQLTSGREIQIDLMNRIRHGKRPSDTDLVRTFRVLNWVMLNYGQWVATTVGSRNVAQWDGWHDALPRDRHSADAAHPEPTFAPEWLGLQEEVPSRPAVKWMKWIVGSLILLAFVIIFIIELRG